MYVLEGQIEFILKNGKTVILNAGEHFVLPKKIRHQCTFKKLTTVLEEIYEKVL